MGGFISSDGTTGEVTNLGRGGSDYSAAIYAAGCNDARLEIWTDVPGIMTANPKVVPSAVTVPTLSYSAAFALAEHGAKVLYAPTVIPARDAGIPFSILNTFFDSFLNCTNHIECLFRKVIMLTFNNFFEASYCIFKFYIFT